MADGAAAFYDGLAPDYDLILQDWSCSVVRQGAVLAEVLRANGIEPPASVLDCTCGIGTQALGLALHGYRVHGTDISPGAIERARREGAALGVEATFAVADVRALADVVADSYSAVVALDNSLAHMLDDDELRRAAASMAARLAPGGVLLASVRDYDRLALERPRATPAAVHGGEGERSVTFQLWTWDADGSAYRMELVVLHERAGTFVPSVHVTRLRALRRGELAAALAAAGLVDVRMLEPEETRYYQPIARAGSRPA